MADTNWVVLGAPFDRGTTHRGAEAAPAAIREAGLTRRIAYLAGLGFKITDCGDVGPPDSAHSETLPTGIDEMPAYAAALMERLDRRLHSGGVPLVLGGDHSISIPTISAVAGFLRESLGDDANVGVVWIDAHPDLETPGPDSTNDLNAMPAAHLLGLGLPELATLGGFKPKVKPEYLVYVGLRDVVPEEKQIINDMAITSYTMSDIERLGIAAICDKTLKYMNEKTDGFVLSFDIDAIDPMMAPGVDYPQPGGITVREAMLIVESFCGSDKLRLFELLEVNPSRDRDDLTSKLAINLIHRAVGGPLI
jgi:arginase